MGVGHACQHRGGRAHDADDADDSHEEVNLGDRGYAAGEATRQCSSVLWVAGTRQVPRNSGMSTHRGSQ